MPSGMPCTKVRVRPLVDVDGRAGSPSDALMDAMYAKAMERSSRCVVYFGSKHYQRDYVPLEIKYGRELVSWRDDDGHVRYSFCDARLGGDQCDFDFCYLQEEGGEVTMFVRPFGSEAVLGFTTPPQDEELEPVAAWVQSDSLFLVMNTPSDDMLDTVAPRDRLPLTSANGGRAFGSMSLWQVPIGSGSIWRSDLTTPMDGWCASVIPNADDGRPGVMIVNMSPHDTGERREPRTFAELLADLRAVTATHREVEVPTGVSVYDPQARAFERISLDGHVDWGIGSIQVMDPESVPEEVGEAPVDEIGVSLLVYDTEDEAGGGPPGSPQGCC